MKVYATCMTYNSEEIIGFVMDHLIAQNVDGIVVSDNESRDGTIAILEGKRKICEERGIDFDILNDPDPALYIDKMHDRLVEAVIERSGGPTWIISAEHDEFWGSTKGPMADVLKSPEVLEIARKPPPGNRLRMTDEFCGFVFRYKAFLVTAEDDPTEPNPLKRMCWRFGPKEPKMPEGRGPRQLQKVIFPADHLFKEKFGMKSGAANVLCKPSLKAKAHPHFWSGGDLFYVRHYSVWSFEQMKRKFRTNKERIEMTDYPKTKGWHARFIGGLSDEDMEKYYWEKCYVEKPREDPNLIYDPFR